MLENHSSETAQEYGEEERRKNMLTYIRILEGFGSNSKEAQEFREQRINDEIFMRRAALLDSAFNSSDTSAKTK